MTSMSCVQPAYLHSNNVSFFLYCCQSLLVHAGGGGGGRKDGDIICVIEIGDMIFRELYPKATGDEWGGQLRS